MASHFLASQHNTMAPHVLAVSRERGATAASDLGHQAKVSECCCLYALRGRLGSDEARAKRAAEPLVVVYVLVFLMQAGEEVVETGWCLRAVASHLTLLRDPLLLDTEGVLPASSIVCSCPPLSVLLSPTSLVATAAAEFACLVSCLVSLGMEMKPNVRIITWHDEIGSKNIAVAAGGPRGGSCRVARDPT